jgi:hypothetical protein
MASAASLLRKRALWARVNLGIPPKEFFGYTPAEILQLEKLWKERELREEHRTARIQTTIAQGADMRLGGRKVDFFDFYTHEKRPRRSRNKGVSFSEFKAALAGARTPTNHG